MIFRHFVAKFGPFGFCVVLIPCRVNLRNISRLTSFRQVSVRKLQLCKSLFCQFQDRTLCSQLILKLEIARFHSSSITANWKHACFFSSQRILHCVKLRFQDSWSVFLPVPVKLNLICSSETQIVLRWAFLSFSQIKLDIVVNCFVGECVFECKVY